MVVICKDEITKLRKLEETNSKGGARGAQQRGGINAAVADDVNTVFKGKTVSEEEKKGLAISSKLHASQKARNDSFLLRYHQCEWVEHCENVKD